MSNKHGNGVLLGICIAIFVIVLCLCIWLYGDKIKSDINDKLKKEDTTQQTEQSQSDNQSIIIKI